MIATVRLFSVILACCFALPALAALNDNGDGTVTDTLTGLMWDKCSWGQTFTQATNTCSAVGDASSHSWSAAMGVAVTANAMNLGDGHRGHADWRVPNIKELESLVKIDTSNPAIDIAFFPNTQPFAYWSSTTYAGLPAYAEFVHFDDGIPSAYSKLLARYVRLVRSGQSFAAFDSMPDTVPNAFSFTAQTGVALNAVTTSNTITVAGTNLPSAISIAGGSYSINGGAYTAVAGTVNNGNTVSVRQTASGSAGTTTTATLTIGGVSGAFDITTLLADTVPNAFSFTAQTGVALGAVATSNTITVAGINAPSAISISGGTYAINGGAYTAAAGTVNNSDTVIVRQTASASYSTTTAATLTIGGVNGLFDVTTLAADTVPDAFSFTAQTGVSLSLLITSNTITVAGINSPSVIGITGGIYSVNGGAYTAGAGTVSNGDTVTVRQTASASNSTTTTATLTIGGVNGAFSVTTVAMAPPPPVATPTIPLLIIPMSCGLRAWPAVVNMSEGEGPAFTVDLVALLANALGQPLAFAEQTACGTVSLSGYNAGKLAFVPHSYQGSGDPRPNGIYAMGDGRYQVVRNGQSLIIAPAVVRLDQLSALITGASTTQGENGVLIATFNGATYVVQPDAAVHLSPAPDHVQLSLSADGFLHFIDAFGNNQLLFPAFADVIALRNALLGLDPGATVSVRLDGTVAISFNGQHYTLVPDLTLSQVPAERVGQTWWQGSETRYWVVNAQPLGTAQGFTVKP